jgi:hypothetical protein
MEFGGEAFEGCLGLDVDLPNGISTLRMVLVPGENTTEDSQEKSPFWKTNLACNFILDFQPPEL